MIDELRKTNKNLILVDSGDMFFKTKSLPQLRARLVLDGMNRMKYDAVTFGEGDLNMDFEFFLKEIAKTSMTYVSSNIQILDKKNKKLLLPYVIKEIDGLKIAVTAITPEVMMDSQVLENKQIKIDDPILALKETIAELKEKSDFIILLSHFGMAGTKNLLTYNDLSDVSLAIAGHGRLMTDTVKKIGDTCIVQNSLGGEYLSMLKFNLDDTGKIIDSNLENIALTKDVPEDLYLMEQMGKFSAKKLKQESTRDEQEVQEASEKESLKILQLSPEAFIKKMKLKNTD